MVGSAGWLSTIGFIWPFVRISITDRIGDLRSRLAVDGAFAAVKLGWGVNPSIPRLAIIAYNRNVHIRRSYWLVLSTAVMLALAGTLAGCGGTASQAPSEAQPGTAAPAPSAVGTNERLPGFSQDLSSDVRSLSLKAGEEITVPVTVKNTGPAVWISAGGAPITLGYHWLRGSDLVPIESPRTLLPAALSPGESVQLNAKVLAPPTPGDYVIRLSMVQEGITWFDNAGGKPLEIPVKVR